MARVQTERIFENMRTKEEKYYHSSFKQSRVKRGDKMTSRDRVQLSGVVFMDSILRRSQKSWYLNRS